MHGESAFVPQLIDNEIVDSAFRVLSEVCVMDVLWYEIESIE